MDELDQHLERKIQYNFLKEIVEVWLPQNSQLWTASHSLGFMEYASDYDQGVIIDLDDRDYDLPQILKPQYKITASTASVAVDVVSLSKLLPDHQVLCVEGKDSTYYGLMDLPLKIIASRHNKHDVYNTATGQIEQFLGLIDRDFLTDEEIELLEEHYPRLAVLRYYSIENYLFHPDNLAEAGYVSQIDAQDLKLNLIGRFKEVKFKQIAELKPSRSSQQFLVKGLGEKVLNNFNETPLAFEHLFESQDFEQVWKVVKAKDTFHKLTDYQYQQVDKSKLTQTDWIRTKINALLLRFDR